MVTNMTETIRFDGAPKNVLVVARTLQGIAHWILSLREAGCRVELARTPAEAIVQAAAFNPEVVVIEDRAADLDSVELSLQIRSTICSKLPPTFIMAVASQQIDRAVDPPATISPDDRQMPLDARPALPQAMRVAGASGARVAGPADAPDQVDCQSLHLDRTRHRASVDGRLLVLTPTEFKLLWELACRPGEVLSRADLTRLCRGPNASAQARTVDAHIKSIRRKLQDQATLIETVHGVGYRCQEIGN
jgi:DNA-binding response OmpR family regulator